MLQGSRGKCAKPMSLSSSKRLTNGAKRQGLVVRHSAFPRLFLRFGHFQTLDSTLQTQLSFLGTVSDV